MVGEHEIRPDYRKEETSAEAAANVKITALLLVRNEVHLLPYTLHAIFQWCDDVILLDHASTDGTADYLRSTSFCLSFGRHVLVEREDDPDWREMDFRHRLHTRARMRGATHLALVDADEVPTGNVLPLLRGWATDLPPGHALRLPMVVPWRTPDAFRVDRGSPYGKGVITALVADHPSLEWAPAADGYQHHARAPSGLRGTHEPYRGAWKGGIFHLQWLWWDRLLWKQRRYVYRDLTAFAGREPIAATIARYAPAVDETALETMPTPATWWTPIGRPPIDAAPGWYVDEARSLYARLSPAAVAALPAWARLPEESVA